MQSKWRKAEVLRGSRDGRTIGFPTANLDPAVMDAPMKRGVYAALVKYEGRLYKGVLYFGPRLVKNELHDVLEIHILDFDGDLYGKILRFQDGPFLRGVMDFPSMEALKAQIETDIRQARSAFRQA